MKIALITGASSGLGAEFTRTIAKQYPDLDEIWVIARRTERLQKLAEEYPKANIIPISMDLTDRGSYRELSRLLSERRADIRILINNAGYCSCGRFDEMELNSIQMMIDLNITALTLVNRVCFPFMKEKSICVLTCSVSSFAPVIGQAVYSASKIYVQYLGHALHAEMKKKGINVLTLCPGNMDTEMNVRGGADEKAGGLPYLDVPKLTVRTMKRAESGKGFYTPGWFYKGYRVLSHLLPKNVMMQLSGGVFGEN